ncbi:hypothetical protein [Paraflavitalea speifideaquila]|uniref:hypothetical protein n=1 Tax=Paraflavitalea speifideaquila TaxID=3076558 RepID=UPI0028E6C50F|nr:hypothetical protein [Paraflavitalea speifideiaquila]
MQANVEYSIYQINGLERGKGATPIQRIRAGIRLLFLKGLTTSYIRDNRGNIIGSNTTWTGGATWEDASKNYNGGGADNYGNVLKMRNPAVDPQPSNYYK